MNENCCGFVIGEELLNGWVKACVFWVEWRRASILIAAVIILPLLRHVGPGVATVHGHDIVRGLLLLICVIVFVLLWGRILIEVFSSSFEFYVYLTWQSIINDSIYNIMTTSRHMLQSVYQRVSVLLVVVTTYKQTHKAMRCSVFLWVFCERYPSTRCSLVTESHCFILGVYRVHTK